MTTRYKYQCKRINLSLKWAVLSVMIVLKGIFFFLSLIECIGFYHNALDDTLYQFEVGMFIIISRFQIEIEI